MKLAWLAVPAVVLCAGCGGTKGPSQAAFRGMVLPGLPAAPAFTLGDQAGNAVALAGERGHYVVVTFLYTHCPDVCPIVAGTLNSVLRTPAAHRAGLRVLAISVDPKGDTPRAVRQFVREHGLGSGFRYLTGTRAELESVWTSFHIQPVAAADGTVTHSLFEILVDPQGRERLIYDSQVTPAAVVHDLSLLEART